MGLAGEAGAFPGAPAGFDPAAPLANPGAAFEQREHLVRQKLVHVETAKVRGSSELCTRVAGCVGAEAQPAADPARASAALLPQGGREPLPELQGGASPALSWEFWMHCAACSATCRADASAQHVTAYLASIREVGVQRINWD